MPAPTEEDFVSRLLALLAQLQTGFSDEMAVCLEQQLRAEFGGMEIYIRKSAPREAMEHDIRHRFNGRNALQLAHEWGISRASVFRIARRAQ